MKIAITGATGLVGQEIVKAFSSQHQISLLSRKRSKGFIQWDPVKGNLDRNQLDGHEVIIHLAGEPIANRRWSSGYKKRIKASRINSTRFLVDNIRLLKQKPKLVICASAIGFYGNHLMIDRKDESSSRGAGFLADVCEAWEEETKALEVGLGIRVVQLRFGIILAKNGGALTKMLPIFNLGLGGRLGNGQQPMSWVSIKEIPDIIDFIIKHDGIFGPVNVVAPDAVTNKEFTEVLCEVLHRPVSLPVPGFMIKLLFGEMGKDLLLNGANVFPNVLVKHDYVFRYPHLKEALTEILR